MIKDYYEGRNDQGGIAVDSLSFPWKLDLSVGNWILKMGENAGLVVTP